MIGQLQDEEYRGQLIFLLREDIKWYEHTHDPNFLKCCDNVLYLLRYYFHKPDTGNGQ